MKKILFVSNIPSPYMVDLVYNIQQTIENYQVYALYTNKNEDNREWKIDNDKLINTTVLQSKIIKIKTKLDYRYIHIPSNIFSYLFEIKPDIIFAWEYNIAAVQCLTWCKTNKKKFIHVTEGTINSEKNIWLIQKLTRKLIIKCADAYLACSTKAKEKLVSWGCEPKEVFLGLLTVDVSKYLEIERMFNSDIILYVGSFAKRKGLDLLIKAMKDIDQGILHIVGNGSEQDKSELQQIAKDNHVENRIVWCDYKHGNELIKEYMEAALFVLPTREDCFGLVLVEAMAAGLPIVSSKYADGAYDVIENGKNGVLVDPYTEEMAININRIINDKSIQKSYSIYSRQHIDKFLYDEVVQNYNAVICKMWDCE